MAVPVVSAIEAPDFRAMILLIGDLKAMVLLIFASPRASIARGRSAA